MAMLTAGHLAEMYFASAGIFSITYYFAWNRNPDCFIVHQEMNLRPSTLWKSTARTHDTHSRPVATTRNAPLNDEQYTILAAAEIEMQTTIDALTTRVDQLKTEVTRLGALHNNEMAATMRKIITKHEEDQKIAIDRIISTLRDQLAAKPSEVHEAATIADESFKHLQLPNLAVATVTEQATKTRYIDALNEAYEEQTVENTNLIELNGKIQKNKEEQRTLIESWERERLARLSYFDFLYFSIGVATSNTFGDLIPNDRSVRYLIVLQLFLSLVLVGLFLNALQTH
jgi:hypothetical protein